MTNNLKFVLLCCILLLFNSCSKTPDENERKKPEEPQTIEKNKLYELPQQKLMISSSEIKDKYSISTYFYKDRASLKFLKRPVNGVEVIHQDLSLKENNSDSHKITVLILKYHDIKHAKKEIDLNFNILENLANKDNIDSFQINMFADQSMGIKFQTRPNPFYLYSRYGNIVVKINGGKDSRMEKLIEILTIIGNKLAVNNDN